MGIKGAASYVFIIIIYYYYLLASVGAVAPLTPKLSNSFARRHFMWREGRREGRGVAAPSSISTPSLLVFIFPFKDGDAYEQDANPPELRLRLGLTPSLLTVAVFPMIQCVSTEM